VLKIFYERVIWFDQLELDKIIGEFRGAFMLRYAHSRLHIEKTAYIKIHAAHIWQCRFTASSSTKRNISVS
jgi:hypothetical protein